MAGSSRLVAKVFDAGTSHLQDVRHAIAGRWLSLQDEALASMSGAQHLVLTILLDETGQDIGVGGDDERGVTQNVLVVHCHIRARTPAGVAHAEYTCPPVVIANTTTEVVLKAVLDRLDVVLRLDANRRTIILGTDSAKSLVRLGKHFMVDAEEQVGIGGEGTDLGL